MSTERDVKREIERKFCELRCLLSVAAINGTITEQMHYRFVVPPGMHGHGWHFVAHFEPWRNYLPRLTTPAREAALDKEYGPKHGNT